MENEFGLCPRLLESPGIVRVKCPGPGMSWKMSFVLEEVPGLCRAMMWTADAVMRTQTPKRLRAPAHLSSAFEQFRCCFVAARELFTAHELN